MGTNSYDVNQLPPRKRYSAKYKKQQNSKLTDPSFASSSSTTTSNSSSASTTDMQTHLDNLLKSQLNNGHSQSPEELLQSAKETAALAAKAARAKANEKAMIASRAVAAAKNALELFASFPSEAVGSKDKSPKKKKHVADEDYLARRLNLAISNSPRVLKDGSVTSTMYDGVDVAGVVDSDSSVDEEEVNRKLLLCDNPVKEKTEEGSSTLGRKRLRVKLKVRPLSMCASKDQENGVAKSPVVENNVGVSQLEGSDGGVGQEVESQECVKENKVVR